MIVREACRRLRHHARLPHRRLHPRPHHRPLTRRHTASHDWRRTRKPTKKTSPAEPMPVSLAAWEFVPEAGYLNLGPGWMTLEDAE